MIEQIAALVYAPIPGNDSIADGSLGNLPLYCFFIIWADLYIFLALE